jgi:hypothetical protein
METLSILSTSDRFFWRIYTLQRQKKYGYISMGTLPFMLLLLLGRVNHGQEAR